MKYDWASIKQEYVQGIQTEKGTIYPTLEEMANKYGCSFVYIRKKSAKENWIEQRHIYAAKLEQKLIEKKTNKLAGQQSDFDYDVYQLTRNLMNYVRVKMNAINKKITENREPSLNEIDQLAKIVKQIQDIGKRALGDEGNIDDVLRFKIEKV